MANPPYVRKLVPGLGAALALLLARDTSADAPKGHFMVGDAVVEDSATELAWERAPTASASGADDAAEYCAQLELEGGGWRLPTLKELYTLVDESRTVPAIDTQVFPDTAPAFYWSSSAVAGFAEFTWAVNFEQGTDGWFPRENEHFVRCVRPATASP